MYQKMSMEDRLSEAKRLEKLQQQLLPYAKSELRELPKELQATVRHLKVLQPITSSGIEKVASVLDRIPWSVYYLTDPDFPDNYLAKLAKKQSPSSDKPTNLPPASSSIPPSTPTKNDKKDELDFGPFDPRKK